MTTGKPPKVKVQDKNKSKKKFSVIGFKIENSGKKIVEASGPYKLYIQDLQTF